MTKTSHRYHTALQLGPKYEGNMDQQVTRCDGSGVQRDDERQGLPRAAHTTCTNARKNGRGSAAHESVRCHNLRDVLAARWRACRQWNIFWF
eukprot:1701250-Pyramimonas_sp.AAC.1